MAKYRIAEMLIEIEGRFENTEHAYRDYLAVTEAPPDFCVSVSDGELAEARAAFPDASPAYAERFAIFRRVAHEASKRGAILLHAATVEVDGKAYAFCAPSGTGKSTHSSLWLKHIEGSELLNDDNPVVRLDDGGATVYGSPWSGKTPCYKNDCVQIGAFVQIKQEPTNHINRNLPLQAFAVLLPSMSTMKWDKRIYGGTCDSVGRLIERVPLYTLGCRPDQEAAEVCHAEVMK